MYPQLLSLFLLLLLTLLTPTAALPAKPWTVSHSTAQQGPNVSYTTCTNNTIPVNRNTDPAYPSAMSTCLADYDTTTWAGMNCNNLGWYKGSHGGYQNPQNCHDACQSCLTDSADAGATDAICWNVFENVPMAVGSNDFDGGVSFGRYVGCYMGFHLGSQAPRLDLEDPGTAD
ncbi:hypothetical protein MMC12_004925 [Toensbergia leucococca]|nr:hypothetical protein [Toensbergia leucococca]